jgi:xylan 1,4-beta-xylosidase
MDDFLRHVTTGTNYATGKVGTPTDFLSFHAKGQPTLVEGHVRMGIANQLKTVDEAFARIAAIPQLADKPIVIGENDPEGCAACPGPQNEYRNGTVYSSYTAASYARIWELADRRHVRLDGALTWAFTFVGQPWFAGYRQLATQGIDLPVMNVFRLFARLGSDQISAVSSREVPLEQVISDGVRGAADVGVLATRSADGKVDILLWHYHDDDLTGPAADVKVVLTGLALDRQTKASVWRVDSQHGDAFTAWQAMGSPVSPTQPQIRALIRAARIAPEPIQIVRRAHDGSLSLDTRLTSHSVELIEVIAHRH